MIKTVGIFHGYGNKTPNSWLTWLNAQLNNSNIETIYPSFPPLGSSTIEEWYTEFSKNSRDLREPIALVGHSAGTVFAFYVAQKTEVMIEKMVLVCPLNNIDGAEFNRPGGENEASFIRHFVHQNFDFELIKSKVKKIIFVFSDDDSKVPYEKTLAYFQSIFPKAKFITLSGYGHVNEKSGITQLPVVLEELLK